MTGPTVLLAGCATVLVAGGFWLGRASSSSAPVTPSASTSPVRTAQLPPLAPRVEPSVAPARAPAVPAIAPDLLADLRDGDVRVRRAAMHELASDRDADVQALLAATRDADLEVSGTATDALGKAYRDGRVPASELVARVRDSSLDPKVRGLALNGLGAVASREAAAVLVDLVQHGTVDERAGAAILLRNQDLADAVPALIGALGDSDARVRELAHDSLASRARGRDFGDDRAAWQAWWNARR